MKGLKDHLRSFAFDRYTLEARLKPGLLMVLPALVTVALWLPDVWTFLGGLTAVCSTCGLTLLLAELARYQGRGVERRMIAANGGKFTTFFLRHRDTTISSSTKKAYHAFLKRNAKREMPSAEAEKANSIAADDQYRGAVEWLLESTRSEKRFPLVRAENISYGFRRNLLGLKIPAMLLLIFCLIADVCLTVRSLHGEGKLFAAGCVLAGVMSVAGLVWLFVVTMDFVEDAGRSYALRLLAQCDVLQGKAHTKGTGSRTDRPPET